MENQVANSFDTVTVIKIVKGMAIAFSATLALALLQYVGTLHFSNPTLTLIVATFVPTAVNVTKEFLAGIKN